MDQSGGRGAVQRRGSLRRSWGSTAEARSPEDPERDRYQMSPTVKPSGNGSVGSTT